MTIFLLAFDLPTMWLQNQEDRLAGELVSGGDARTLAVFLALYALSFSRLMNNGNLILDVLRRDRFLVAFIGWIVLSSLWSADIGLTSRRSAALALTTAFAVFMVIRFGLREILGMTCIAFAAGTLLSYFLVFAVPSAGSSAAGWIGLFVNKNALGRHEALAAVVYVVGSSVIPRWRVPLMICLAGAVGLVLGSTSATSLVGLIAVMANYWVFRVFRARSTLFGAVVVSMTATTAAAVAVTVGNLALLTKLLGKDVTLTGRTDLWSAVWSDVGRRPWTGWGWDSYWNGFFSPSHELWVSLPWHPPHSHNALLDYLLVIGLPGAMLFLVMFLRGIARSARFIRDHPGGIGLFPIMMMTFTLVFSLTEAGVVGRNERWMLAVVALLAVGDPGVKQMIESLKSPEQETPLGVK